MLYESLLDTKPNKENGPWPLPGTLVKPDWRSEKSHFSWKCDAAYVYYCFSIFSLFWLPPELIFSEIKGKWCWNVILGWIWSTDGVPASHILKEYMMWKIMKKCRPKDLFFSTAIIFSSNAVGTDSSGTTSSKMVFKDFQFWQKF